MSLSVKAVSLPFYLVAQSTCRLTANVYSSDNPVPVFFLCVIFCHSNFDVTVLRVLMLCNLKGKLFLGSIATPSAWVRLLEAENAILEGKIADIVWL
jgi:hypothetical protein